MTDYLRRNKLSESPRIPLEGSIDLTYRCNNNCRHCWSRESAEPQSCLMELCKEEIKAIVEDARKMGCRRWSISGGEPMLRPDFAEIFDYITRRSASYSINTNGTMITPEIARLMRRNGRKMIALYGPNAKIHDYITRNPGSFQATMEGISMLKVAGAEFIVQLIPMRDNYDHFKDMKNLARRLSPKWRVGAPWLYLSASGNLERNIEIKRQRLDAGEAIRLDHPDVFYEKRNISGVNHSQSPPDDRLFSLCIAQKRYFHIDPYGMMSFCCFIKVPEFRYDLRKGSFKDAWEEFIPSLAHKVRGGKEYMENCQSCQLQENCRWCPVYGYLEHRRFSAPVEYLCEMAKEATKFKDDWELKHCRYFECAGITIRVESDEEASKWPLQPTINLFQIERPRDVMISIKHSSDVPDLKGKDLGAVIYEKGCWIIRRKGNSLIYLRNTGDDSKNAQRIAVFNQDHTSIHLYSQWPKSNGALDLSQIHYDQIFLSQSALAHILARLGGFFIHSSGVVIEGKGILFVGHSGIGKSTIRSMMLSKSDVKPLCDDRNVLRKCDNGTWVYGTWANKDFSDVSAASAPLGAIMFLEQAHENKIIPIYERLNVVKKILACIIRPLESVEWWNQSLKIVNDMAKEVPCYSLRFNLKGDISDIVRATCRY